jgi:hypothetical protein
MTTKPESAEVLTIGEAQGRQCPYRGGMAPCTTRSCMAWRVADEAKRTGYCVLLVPKT